MRVSLYFCMLVYVYIHVDLHLVHNTFLFFFPETMSFAVDDLEKNCSLENHTKECSLKDQINEYYDYHEHRSISNLVLSVSCKVTTGYPPFKSIQWNISDGLEDLSPCVFYTDNNQVGANRTFVRTYVCVTRSYVKCTFCVHVLCTLYHMYCLVCFYGTYILYACDDESMYIVYTYICYA